ncbi:gluconokinase-like [Papaver somniferum]|nr:gluconokinase-like [Papaver somniferum]
MDNSDYYLLQHHHQPDHDLHHLNNILNQQQQIITTTMNHNKGSLETTAPMVFVIMGVSGSGKTTIGELLAKTMDFGFLDADDFHPLANIEKMSRGIPLNEEDRIPWLETLRDTLRTKINQIVSSSNGTYDDADDDKKRKAVLCCSALQKKYREILRTADPNYKPGSYVPGRVKFIYLETPFEVLLNRVNKRAAQGKHFMPASLLQSQLDLLQIDNEQEKDITVVDGTLPPQLIVNDIRSLIL